jgi:hypothetical protein
MGEVPKGPKEPVSFLTEVTHSLDVVSPSKDGREKECLRFPGTLPFTFLEEGTSTSLLDPGKDGRFPKERILSDSKTSDVLES